MKNLYTNLITSNAINILYKKGENYKYSSEPSFVP